MSWPIPAGIDESAGYTVKAVIDPDNQIVETDENNNSLSKTI